MELVPMTIDNLPVQSDVIGYNAAVQVMLRCHIERQRDPIAVKITSNNASLEKSIENLFDPGRDDIWVRIHKPDPLSIEMGWCIPPLFGNYSNTELLIEQLEWAKLQGYGKVFVYVFEISPAVNVVLRFYEQQGLVKIIPWSAAALFNVPLWYYGQKLALNNCLYRNLGRVRFLTMHDLDERLIDPNGISVLHQTHKLLEENKDACAFYLPQVQYYHDVGRNGTLNHQVKPFLSEKFKLSKVISLPARVEMLWVHSVDKAMPGFHQVSITSNNSVFMAHFSQYPIKSYIHDDTFDRVSVPLRQRVRTAKKRIFGLN